MMNKTFGLKHFTRSQVLFLIAFIACYSVFTMTLLWLSLMGLPDIEHGEAPADAQIWGKVSTVLFNLFGLPFYSPLIRSTNYAWGQRLLYGDRWWQELLFWSAPLINSTFWGICLTVWWAKKCSCQKTKDGSDSA